MLWAIQIFLVFLGFKYPLDNGMAWEDSKKNFFLNK